ncbi:MAG: hypothetical protein ACRDTU_14350 [Micromonosporaceae bacterium]
MPNRDGRRSAPSPHDRIARGLIAAGGVGLVTSVVGMLYVGWLRRRY